VCVCVASSEELVVLTQLLLSLDWLNHTKYGPLCFIVPHVGAGVCLRLCPPLPHLVLTAFAQQSLTFQVCVCLSLHFLPFPCFYLCLVCVAKEYNYWVKKCMEFEVEGARPRGGPKRTWREVVQKDCQVRILNRDDAMDRSRWRKIKDD